MNAEFKLKVIDIMITIDTNVHEMSGSQMVGHIECVMSAITF
jgi:hypothetical protein